MKSRFVTFSLMFAVSMVFLPAIVLASQQVLGKQEAPGQIKKQVSVEVNVGRIEEVKPGKIEIKSQGKKIEINTATESAIIEKPSGVKLNLGQLKKNDQIAIIATPSVNLASISARLILIKSATKSATISAALKPTRRAIYGLVREINGNILTVSHPIKDNPRYKVQVIGTTIIKMKGLPSPILGDIKVGDRIAAVGDWSGDILVAKKVHVIPGKAIGLFGRLATKSATPSATASPSATATPSATPKPTATTSATP
jgi:hypothetical protein